MNRVLRKYHRSLALLLCLPLALTVVTGMATTLVGEWSLGFGLSRRFLLKLHTGELWHLQAVYPLLNGLGLMGLLVTGLSMSGLCKRKIYGA